MASESLEQSEHLKLIMESMEEDKEEHSERFKIIVALLLGFVTILGGFIAWRIAVSYEHAGIIDLAGLSATINAEETHALDNAQLYEHYRAFTSYVQYDELAKQIADDSKNASAEQAAPLSSQLDETARLAAQNKDFFPQRFLNRDGSYNSQRELAEAWSNAMREEDIDPTLHFAKADQLRGNTNLLFGMLILLAGSLWFFTLAEIFNHKIRYAMAALGVGLLIAAAIGVLVVEYRL